MLDSVPRAPKVIDPGSDPDPRALAAAWALGLVALIAAFQWPAASPDARLPATAIGLLSLVAISIATLGGLHRPVGPVSGLEALAVPLAVAGLGLSRGSLALGLGSFLGSLAFDARDRSWQPTAAAARAGRVGLATLAAGGLWILCGGRRMEPHLSAWPWVAAGSVYVAVALATSWALSGRVPRRRNDWLALVAIESVAFAIGAVLATPARSATAAGLGFAAAAILAIAVVWAEAGRQARAATHWQARARLASQAATCDPITGLERGESLRARLGFELERSRREGHPVALALFDLDGLRRTNAEQGMTTGDERLRRLALRLNHWGYAARWHGGSVAWILPQRSGREALALVEAVRRAAELEANLSSCGVVATPEVAARDADDLLAMAEAGLVIAKRLGRSRALLDLGGGRFVDGDGRSVDTAMDEERDPSLPPQTPTFFA